MCFCYLLFVFLVFIARALPLVIARLGTSRGNLFDNNRSPRRFAPRDDDCLSRYCEGRKTRGNLFNSGRSPRRSAPRDDVCLSRHCEGRKTRGNLSVRRHQITPFRVCLIYQRLLTRSRPTLNLLFASYSRQHCRMPFNHQKNLQSIFSRKLRANTVSMFKNSLPYIGCYSCI